MFKTTPSILVKLGTSAAGVNDIPFAKKRGDFELQTATNDEEEQVEQEEQEMVSLQELDTYWVLSISLLKLSVSRGNIIL